MSRLTYIGNYRTRAEADVAQSFLEANGIPSVVAGDNFTGISPYSLRDDFDGSCLMVHEENKDRAFVILERAAPSRQYTRPNGYPLAPCRTHRKKSIREIG